MMQETDIPVVLASDVRLFIDKCSLHEPQKAVLRARLNGLCSKAEDQLTANDLDLVFEGSPDLRKIFIPQ